MLSAQAQTQQPRAVHGSRALDQDAARHPCKNNSLNYKSNCKWMSEVSGTIVVTSGHQMLLSVPPQANLWQGSPSVRRQNGNNSLDRRVAGVCHWPDGCAALQACPWMTTLWKLQVGSPNLSHLQGPLQKQLIKLEVQL